MKIENLRKRCVYLKGQLAANGWYGDIEFPVTGKEFDAVVRYYINHGMAIEYPLRFCGFILRII